MSDEQQTGAGTVPPPSIFTREQQQTVRSSSTLFTLPFAGQPDIVLASQKDQVHQQELRDLVYSIAEGALGPQTSSQAKPELSFCADFFYHLLTTFKGRQTLGEEYCDLYYFEPDGHTRFNVDKRRALALCLALLPYLQVRLANGGWTSLWSALRRETARERAAAMARRAQQQRMNATETSTGDGGYQANKLSFAFISATVLSIAAVMGRAHLGAFYWRGDYLDPLKRLFAARYAFTREPASQRPSYWILSVFIAIQLVLQGGSATIEWISKGTGSTTNGVFPTADCVPSLSPDEQEEESRSGKFTSLFTNPCGICLSPLKSPACPPCGHVYCYECIVESCVAKSECPLCRREATPQSVQSIYV